MTAEGLTVFSSNNIRPHRLSLENEEGHTLMRETLKQFRRSRLLRSAITVISGNSLAQIIVLLFAPIITRIYSPEVFGVQGVFLAAISLLAPIIALRFPMAIVMAKNSRDIRDIEILSIRTACTTSLIALLALIFFQPQFSQLLGLQGIGYLVYFLPLALFFTALQEISNYKAARDKRFRAISVVAAVQALIVNSARVLGGMITPAASILVSISSLAPGIHAAMLTLSKRANHEVRNRTKKNNVRIWVIARENRDFALLRMPTDLLNAASQTAPVILLSFYFGPLVAGWYALTKSALTMPSNVIGNALGTVFYSHFAEKDRNGQPLTGLTIKSTLFLLFGPGSAIIAVAYFGPDLFAFIFGEDWREAGTYARWLAFATALSLANVPAVRLAPVIKRQGTLLIANVLFLFTRAGSIFVSAALFHDPLYVVMAFSGVSALGSVVLILTMILLGRSYDSSHSQNSHQES